MRYIVALYEMDRAWGGPEEGSWWYDSGELVLPLRIFSTEMAACSFAARINRMLDRLQVHRRSVDSVLYDGGLYRACLFEKIAPGFFPERRPYYS